MIRLRCQAHSLTYISLLHPMIAKPRTTSRSTRIYREVSLSSYLEPIPILNRSSLSEWLSGDDSLEMTWSAKNTGALTIVQANLVQEEPFQIVSEVCQDGTVFYATQSVRLLART